MFPCEDSKTVSVRLSVPREKNSPWLRQYQSYISNWYINGKVFTSTTAWKPKNLNFFSKKFEIEFWLVPKSLNHLNFINISPTLVIDTSVERSSRVLHHGNPKIWFFLKKKLKLNFDLCQRAEIVQVGLNMNLYDQHWGCMVVPSRVDI